MVDSQQCRALKRAASGNGGREGSHISCGGSVPLALVMMCKDELLSPVALLSVSMISVKFICANYLNWGSQVWAESLFRLTAFIIFFLNFTNHF